MVYNVVNSVNSDNKEYERGIFMVDTTYFKLCGGLFFNTVLICRRARTSARETRFKGSDGLNEPAVLGGLIEVFNPSYEHPSNRSLSTNTTRYKKCAISNGAYLPFNDHAAIEAFNNSVLTNYSEPLSKMTMFCNSFLDRATRMGRVQTCVKILLDIIAADESIGIDQKFYVMPDGSPLTKKDLSSISHLFWQPFLLGVWHFIVVNRPTNDLGGRSIDDFIEKYCLREDYPYVFRAGYSVTIDNYISDNSDNSKSSSGNADELYDYSEYLIKTKNKYSEIKTLLYNEAPHKFYDFYVCNNIGRKGPNYSDHYLPANVMKLVARGTKRIILTGTGGLGKSMMMRHLLLSAIDEYETTKIVPLFIPLKNYTDDCDTILDYIFSCTSAICDIKKEQLVYSLKFGSISLLLDGLDEIRIELINKFQKRLEEFIDEYPNVIIVISSRPFQDFIGFNRFSVLEVKPFTKMQALELIDRLEFRPDEPDFKEKFRYELENNLYDSHREFCTNPLLLTIMLMTFEQFAEIPSKMHIFYREAYLALAQKHDASKGGFKRTLSSGLSVERFSDFLSEFCMRTYHDEKFEFTHEEFVKYFNSLKELKKNPTESVTAQSFLYDLLSGMCLLYYEGSKYHFTHRSFQEYFCALFFSKQKDKTLGAIGDFFESRKRRMRANYIKFKYFL